MSDGAFKKRYFRDIKLIKKMIRDAAYVPPENRHAYWQIVEGRINSLLKEAEDSGE